MNKRKSPLTRGKETKAHLRAALSDSGVLMNVVQDFAITFGNIGLRSENAHGLAANVIGSMVADCTMTQTLDAISAELDPIRANGMPFGEALKHALRDRTKKIFHQIRPFLDGVTGRVIDFGAGSGEVAQQLHDGLGLKVEAFDIVNFKSPEVSVPFSIFDGKRVPVPGSYYEAGVLTNVLHHESKNELILKELDRIVSRRLVILETVPLDDSKAEWERTFVNDVLWNPVFNDRSIPVPGTYERPDGWVRRFREHNWQLFHSEDLGYDQPTIRDLHHLLVFEKRR